MASSLVKSETQQFIIQNMSWSLDETRVALKESLFNNIPNEIIFNIFRFLSVPDLCNVALVCRSFKMIADHDQIWKPKCNIMVKLHSKSYRQIYMEWIHEKSLRNKKLLELRRFYMSRTACVICPRFTSPRFASPFFTYPLRPGNKRRFQSIGGFNQHPNSTQEMTITLSVNIDKTTPQLISLLKKASTFQQQWQQSVVIKQMIQRYYRFLQLKASQPSNILLIPTLDIEMIWQTHLLRPEIYRNDCLRLFGRVIDHSLIMKNDMEEFFKEQAFFGTCQLYEQKFGEKYCSLPSFEKKKKVESKFDFDDDESDESMNDNEPIYSYWDLTHFEFSSNSPNNYENPFSFTEGDFIFDGKWFNLCKQFMSKAIEKIPKWKIYFYDKEGIDLGSGALKRLKKSYERFLYMAAKYPLKDGNGFIPPTYAIDIIWHSHMQEPLNYEADCLRLVGYVIYHDPWPIVEDKNMKKSYDHVDKIWKDEFRCEIDIDHLYNTPDNKDNGLVESKHFDILSSIYGD